MNLAEKLQKAVDGKELVVNKINLKAESNLTKKSSWEEIGEVVSNLNTWSLKKVLDNTKSMAYLFRYSTIENPESFIGYSDTSEVVDMSYAFDECIYLVNIPSLDTSKVTNMQYAFRNCRNVKSMSLLNTSSVTNMSHTFEWCKNLEEILLTNTSKIQRADYMFKNTGLYEIELNLESLTSAYEMFFGSYIKKVKLNNCVNLQGYNYMFSNCGSLEQIDLSHFNCSSGANGTFDFCYRLKELIIHDIDDDAYLTTLNSCYWLTKTYNERYNPETKQGYVYIPRNKIDIISTNTGWKNLPRERFRALEDYTVDWTTTGEIRRNAEGEPITNEQI